MADSDDDEQESCIAVGTPLVNVSEVGRRARKALVVSGAARHDVPPWQQEVLDENGKRRFHGAFSGGFSAGYFNTVGSKEGWAPSTFKSSRRDRAGQKKQQAEDFMDEEEKAELHGSRLTAKQEFDTFGTTAADLARRQAQKESAGEPQQRPDAIPNLVPDEVIVPATESLGLKLLRRMGWRHGRKLGPRKGADELVRAARRAADALSKHSTSTTSTGGAESTGRKVYGPSAPPPEALDNDGAADALAVEEDASDLPKLNLAQATPSYVLKPKSDRHGLGHDPYRDAPEFRAHRDERVRQLRPSATRTHGHRFGGSMFRPHAHKTGSGFGVGVLEGEGDEDEDVYVREDASHYDIPASLDEESRTAAARPDNAAAAAFLNLDASNILACFEASDVREVEGADEAYPPPLVPPDYEPVHRFEAPMATAFEGATAEDLAQDAVTIAEKDVPSEGSDLRKTIESLAAYVAKNGPQFEAMVKERQRGDPKFCFLLDNGPGQAYYAYRLSQLLREKHKRDEQQQRQQQQSRSRLDANQRAHMLGEQPAVLPAPPPVKPGMVFELIPEDDRLRLQAALAGTFTAGYGSGGSSDSKPFQADAAKQARYEDYMQQATVGGLRKLQPQSPLTQEERVRERDEFERTARALKQGPFAEAASQSRTTLAPAGAAASSFAAAVAARFSVGSESLASKPAAAKRGMTRESHPWHPEHLLCKRFGLADPYAGQKPPPPKASKMDSLVLLSSATPEAPTAAAMLALPQATHASTPALAGERKHAAGAQVIVVEHQEEDQQPPETYVEKPIDLFKAIFEDDSDEDDVEVDAGIDAAKDAEPRASSAEAEPKPVGAAAATAALNRLAAADFFADMGVEEETKEEEEVGGARDTDSLRPAFALRSADAVWKTTSQLPSASATPATPAVLRPVIGPARPDHLNGIEGTSDDGEEGRRESSRQASTPADAAGGERVDEVEVVAEPVAQLVEGRKGESVIELERRRLRELEEHEEQRRRERKKRKRERDKEKERDKERRRRHREKKKETKSKKKRGAKESKRHKRSKDKTESRPRRRGSADSSVSDDDSSSSSKSA